MKQSCRTVVFIALALALAGAAANEAPQRKPVPPQNVGGLADAKDAGEVKGVVLFKGTKPEPRPISEVAGNAFCKEHHKDKPPVRDNFVFGKNGDNDTLANVLVYVSKGLEGKDFEPPKQPAVLDQVGCMYTPHVVGVMVGQTLEVRNSDATLHNVMSSPRNNPAFNFGMPVQGGTYNLVFKAPEMKMNTKCFMHPWMSGYVHVLEHPFFAVTGEDGTFEIQGVPAGTQNVIVWQEKAGYVTPGLAKGQPVEVKANGAADMGDITLDPAKVKK
jgi:plastocyanin